MKNKSLLFSLIFLLILTLFNTSCKNKEFTDLFSQESEEEEKNPGTHTWYSFSAESFVKVDKPENGISNPLLPWTEAVRLSSANLCEKGAFAIVNRLGVLAFNNDQISLTKDVTLFTNRTAGNLVFIDEIPMFTVYKSAFFNNSIKKPEYKFDKSQHYFLVQYDLNSKICYPVLNCNNFVEPPESEIIDYVWDGLNWICNIKTISDGKIKFSYLSWSPTVPLSSLSPVSATPNISIREVEKDVYRNAKQIEDFSKAPERIKTLLTGVSERIPFQVELIDWRGGSLKTYKNKAGSNKMVELKCKGLLYEDWSGILFEDGTFYFEGCLKDRHILRGGRPVVIRLPKLPAGFVYTDFVISEQTLYAGWEERAFFRTGRSGFLSVNLDKTLYNEVH